MGRRNRKKSPEGPRKKLHPTVAFRVSLEDRVRLHNLTKERRQTLGQILHVGLGLIEERRVSERDSVAKAERSGHARGYGEKFGKFEVACAECHKPMAMDMKQQEVHEAVERGLSNWVHGGCKKESRARLASQVNAALRRAGADDLFYVMEP